MGMIPEEAIEILEEVKAFDDSMYAYNPAYSEAIDLAIEALKAQEPRVMTLEELADWHKKPESERDPIYVEYLPNSGLGTSKWTIEYFGFNPNLYPNKNSGYYGKWLRCWTSRPTLEQRETTPWQ